MFKLKLLVFLDIYITKHMFNLKLLVFSDIYNNDQQLVEGGPSVATNTCCIQMS
jgi:hypothetical protein